MARGPYGTPEVATRLAHCMHDNGVAVPAHACASRGLPKPAAYRARPRGDPDHMSTQRPAGASLGQRIDDGRLLEGGDGPDLAADCAHHLGDHACVRHAARDGVVGEDDEAYGHLRIYIYIL